MKIYDSLIDITEYYYEPNSQSLNALGVVMIVLFSSLLFIYFAIAPLWISGEINSQNASVFWIWVWSIPVITGLLSFPIILVDLSVKFVTNFVTRGRTPVERYLVTKLEKNCEAELDFTLLMLGNVLIGVYILIPVILIKLAFFTSGWISLAALTLIAVAGTITACLYLARWVFDLQLKIRDHIKDPKAHQ